MGTRSIPAWAGEPAWTGISQTGMRVYPRVGGGTTDRTVTAIFDDGLSPRGRGNRYHLEGHLVADRSIPAWAGEPAGRIPAIPMIWVYPRVGGGTLLASLGMYSGCGLSPRGRGNRLQRNGQHRSDRSIPAWAGEPTTPHMVLLPEGVYPRVGGGTSATHSGDSLYSGLSPRGRGNPA